MIHLVCGYRRTGKDTLVKMFNGEEEFNWVVYKNPNNKVRFQIINVDRVGFADAIRREVNQMLDLSEIVDYNTFKEVVIRDGKTYRDFLREHGAYRRNQDVNYWVCRAADWEDLTDEVIMITDWRFVNELEYLKNRGLDIGGLDIVTIRLFRSEVPIPPDGIVSEHQLDNTTTDFLLLPKTNTGFEFERACSLFPQYKNYIKHDILCTRDCRHIVSE